MIKPIIKIALTFFFLLVFLKSNSQKTFIYKDAYKSYKIAQELYDKEKFSSAQSYFKDIIKNLRPKFRP